MPRSLARWRNFSKNSGLISSPSTATVCRSTGMSSVLTNRRSDSLNIRSSSGSSKSITLLPIVVSPDDTNVDRDRALLAYHQRVDLDIFDARAMIQKELRQREHRRFQRGPICRRPATEACEQLVEFEAVYHGADAF